MIKNCLMKDQPSFYKDVFHPATNEKLATIHAFTENDLEKIDSLSVVKHHPDGSFEFITTARKIYIEKIFLALQGEKCGWELDLELTRENIGNLSKVIYSTLKKSVIDLEKSYSENKEDLEKN